MDVKIEIVTRTLGKTTRFCADGKSWRTEEGVCVTYPTEGDISSLALSPARAVMKRRGLHEFEAAFSAGETSSMAISFQGHRSAIPLVTKVYKIFFSGSDVFLRLVYELGSDPSQKFSLKIQIKVISEEQ